MEKQKTLLHEVIIKFLKEGYTQKEISNELKKNGERGYSLSSIEKELKLIRGFYQAKTMFHLGYILNGRKNN